MYHVNITEPAEYDMLEAAKYTAKKLQNLQAANRLLDETDDAIFSLEEMPYRYPLVNDDYLASLGMRFIIVRNYVVFNIVREERKTVVVERFIHGTLDWASMLKRN